MKTILEELIKKIDFNSNHLSDLEWYIGKDIAFGVVKEYPKNLLKRMRIIGDGRYFAHIRFGVDQKGDNNKFPITIVCHLIYQDIKNAKDYLFNNRFIKRKMLSPRDIYVIDEYFLDTKENKLFRKKRGKYIPIDLLDILNNVFISHVRTYFLIRPIFLILRKKVFQVLLLLCHSFQAIIRLILWVIFGVSYNYDYLTENRFFRFNNKNLENENHDKDKHDMKIPFFGFNVSRYKLFRFVIINLAIYFYFINDSITATVTIGTLSTSMVIFLFYIIAAWVVYEDIFPFVLRNIVKLFSYFIYKLKLHS